VNCHLISPFSELVARVAEKVQSAEAAATQTSLTTDSAAAPCPVLFPFTFWTHLSGMRCCFLDSLISAVLSFGYHDTG
jgi:hypothetical protein